MTTVPGLHSFKESVHGTVAEKIDPKYRSRSCARQQALTVAPFTPTTRISMTFRTKLRKKCSRILKKSLEPIKQFGHERLTLVRITAAVFQCLKDNSDLCTVTLGDYGDKAFALKLVNLGREKCIAAYSKYFRDASPKKLEYYYAFVSSGCIGLLQKMACRRNDQFRRGNGPDCRGHHDAGHQILQN